MSNSCTLPSGSCSPSCTLCPYYGCLTSPICPLDCYTYLEEATCNAIDFNGKSCKFENGFCGRNIQCKQSENCEEGCRKCGYFGCLPHGYVTCPPECKYYPKDRCETIRWNNVECKWIGSECGYVVKPVVEEFVPKVKVEEVRVDLVLGIVSGSVLLLLCIFGALIAWKWKGKAKGLRIGDALKISHVFRNVLKGDWKEKKSENEEDGAILADMKGNEEPVLE